MNTLTRDDLLSNHDIKIERVLLPGLDAQVFVKEMTAGEQDRFQIAAGKDSVIRARLVAICACDESGERLFHDGDVQLLSQKPAWLIDGIFDAAQRLNKLSEDAAGELEKN